MLYKNRCLQLSKIPSLVNFLTFFSHFDPPCKIFWRFSVLFSVLNQNSVQKGAVRCGIVLIRTNLFLFFTFLGIFIDKIMGKKMKKKPAARPPGRPKKYPNLRKDVVLVLRTLRAHTARPPNTSTMPRPGQRGTDRWKVSYAEIRKALGTKVRNERLISACKGLMRTRKRPARKRASPSSQEDKAMSQEQWRGYASSQGRQGW